jgi:hypothetical protein
VEASPLGVRGWQVPRVVLCGDGFCGGRLVLGRWLASCQARGNGKRRVVTAREACWRTRVMSAEGGPAVCFGYDGCSGWGDIGIHNR